MEVLLLKDVSSLGHAGDVKQVAGGYASNYLIPRGLAVVVTGGVRKQVKDLQDATTRRKARERAHAQALADQLSGLTLNFNARAGESDRLYGSITNADIAVAIEQALGRPMDKRDVLLEHPLRELGTHHVPVKLMGDIKPQVTVVIQREGEA